jgi:hypothetical protein
MITPKDKPLSVSSQRRRIGLNYALYFSKMQAQL